MAFVLTEVGQILDRFLKECRLRKIEVDEGFAYFYIHLLVRDARIVRNVQDIVGCKLQYFLERAIKKYTDPSDATACNLKLVFFYKNCKVLNLENVKKKYEELFHRRLSALIEEILLYPETTNQKQIEEMFHKMQVFTIACYNLGCPNNTVLLKQTQQSLNSVIGRGDLQNYVMKKKYHRLEYLQRLGATVCGIVIYNNQGPMGDKDHMRDIFGDLDMAQRNTKRSLQKALQRIASCREYGTDFMTQHLQINVAERKVYCRWPMEKLKVINNFSILFTVYERVLKQLLVICDKTVYLISIAKGKMKCVIDKINDVLKFRVAIESELIFPHFVYLSELWSTLFLYLNHLVEINKAKEHMDTYVTDELEAKFVNTVQNAIEKSPLVKQPNVSLFGDSMTHTTRLNARWDLTKIREYMKPFCSLTMALTNGLIVPANIHKKLCEDSSLRFGFNNIEYGKYAERHFEDYLNVFKNAIYTSLDLILLFNLEDDVLLQDLEEFKARQPKRRSLETQTEMVLTNDLSAPNRINVTWNIWDFHRETINMANLRRRQTHPTQTALTYGRRNAQNQAYNIKRDI